VRVYKCCVSIFSSTSFPPLKPDHSAIAFELSRTEGKKMRALLSPFEVPPLLTNTRPFPRTPPALLWTECDFITILFLVPPPSFHNPFFPPLNSLSAISRIVVSRFFSALFGFDSLTRLCLEGVSLIFFLGSPLISPVPSSYAMSFSFCVSRVADPFHHLREPFFRVLIFFVYSFP